MEKIVMMRMKPRLHVAARAPAAAPAQNVDADRIWQQLRETAADVAAREPLLRQRMQALLAPDLTPAAMLATVLARRLACDDLPQAALQTLMQSVFDDHEGAILTQVAADLAAVKERDPACPDYLHVLLNLKGFQALQTHRAAHALWRGGRSELAFALASQASLAFAVDIHPAARIGAGVMLDHGTGIVIGETTVIEDNVSILQNVTLGGTGKQHGDRHPKIRSGVLIGAGATILGNIDIGTMSKVAAGSVVLKPVPPHCTVAGVPARIVREHQHSCPSTDMDQTI
jgi:serine O-acetyltransferase